MVENELRQKPAATPRNLTKKFGDFAAVDNISFAVNKGEIFGFRAAMVQTNRLP